MAEIDTQIWMALKNAVQSAAGTIPVAWPGEKFTPPKSAKKLTPFIAMGDTQTALRAFINSPAPLERNGIVTLAFVAPLGYDAAWYVEQAARLLAFFPVDGGSRFQSVCVRWGNGSAVPRVERGFQDSGYFRTPIIIPWRCSA